MRTRKLQLTSFCLRPLLLKPFSTQCVSVLNYLLTSKLIGQFLFVYDNFQPTELFFNWQGPLCRVHYAFPEAIGELYIPPIVFQLGGGGMEIHHLNKSFHPCYLLSTMFDDDVTSIFCTCTLSVSLKIVLSSFHFSLNYLVCNFISNSSC